MCDQNYIPSFKPLGRNSKNVSLKNWQIICRSCLCEIENEHFSLEDAYLDREVFVIYENVTSLKIELSNTLPKKLCPTCYQELIRFDSFKNNALESERLLLAVTTVRREIIDEHLSEKVIEVSSQESPVQAKRRSLRWKILDGHLPEKVIEASNEKSPVQAKKQHLRKEIIDGHLPEKVDEESNKESPVDAKVEGHTVQRDDSAHDLALDPILDNLSIENYREGFEDFNAQLILNNQGCIIDGLYVKDDSEEDHKTPVKSEKFLVCDELLTNSVPKIKTRKRRKRKLIPKSEGEEHEVKNEKEICSECGKEVLSYRIEDHMRTHTKEKPFSCHICAAKFADRSNLRRHVKLHLNYRPFVCEICGKDFIRPSSKKIHMLTAHKQEKDVFCPICEKAFKHKMFLKKHMASVHNKSDDPAEEIPSEYPCIHCDKVYKFKSSLYAHEKRHVEPRPFLCNTCGKSFTTKAIMQNHERIHTGEMIFNCTVCGRSFRTLSTLKTHELVHKGEKPLTCQFCNKQFRQHAHLKTHIRGQHDGERPYICDYCGKSFKQSSNLRVHIRLHTGETPFHCDECGKGFYDSSRLKRHNKRHKDIVGVDIKMAEKSPPHEEKEEPSLSNRPDNWPDF